MTILVTGSSGFIGFSLCKDLINKNIPVLGFDNMNPYYDKSLKESRKELLISLSNKKNSFFKQINNNLENHEILDKIFEDYKIKTVIHLAAQAGVRYSLQNPISYINSNILGFVNILENCKNHKINNLIFASSSSVYGGNKQLPFKEKDGANHPISLYAATKKSNELMAHAYSHLYNLPCIGLRFFTVYGPWGRPDMAPMIFTKSILESKEIKIFNEGDLSRDFTYIDDAVAIITELINKPPSINSNFDFSNPDPSSSWAPYRIYNVGNNRGITILRFIELLENEIGIKAKKSFLPMQPGDVKSTAADISSTEFLECSRKKTSIEIGIKNFINWYKNYYQK
tara:strand:- start:2520 stop:3542 length:1023 start_codon:yes stop_codon:yes gene_type:complete